MSKFESIMMVEHTILECFVVAISYVQILTASVWIMKVIKWTN